MSGSRADGRRRGPRPVGIGTVFDCGWAARAHIRNHPRQRGSPRVILVEQTNLGREIPRRDFPAECVPPGSRCRAGAKKRVRPSQRDPGKSVQSIIRHTSADVTAKRTRHPMDLPKRQDDAPMQEPEAAEISAWWGSTISQVSPQLRAANRGTPCISDNILLVIFFSHPR